MVSSIILVDSSVPESEVLTPSTRFGGKTLLEYMVDVLHSACVLDIVIVIKAGSDEMMSRLNWFQGRILTQTKGSDGEIAVVLAGAEVLEKKDLHGVMVCPISHPFMTQALIVELLQSFWKSKKRIVLPVHDEQNGYPQILSCDLFDELKALPSTSTLSNVVNAHVGDTYRLATGEKCAILR